MTRQVMKGLVCSGRTFALSKVRAMEGSERREGCALTQVLRGALWLLWEEEDAQGSGRSCRRLPPYSRQMMMGARHCHG